MTLFDGLYPFYPQQRKAAVFDISTVVVIAVFLTLAFSFLLIIAGIRGRARLYWTLRVLLSLSVGAMIVGNPVKQINETIDYNEHFPWNFGADYEHSYSEGLEKGLPSPILYVAEKFIRQSPCAVHRQYRIAGHYASAVLWVAFCTWIISNILLSMPVLVYGGYMLLVTGAFTTFSLLSFSTARSSPMCLIKIGSRTLHVAYGGSFWLVLAIGLLCFLVGTTIVAMHHLNLDLLKTFFDLHEDKAEEYQEMPEVFINPHFVNKGLFPSQHSEINSI
uniref:Dual oxidase maturation factor 2-like n=1 Tax=Cyanistes caeruleus TaxID=156563 RepID=A0A8C0UJ38_CYACU